MYLKSLSILDAFREQLLNSLESWRASLLHIIFAYVMHASHMFAQM